jgi:molybdenum cofactor cytidylyltransferase
MSGVCSIILAAGRSTRMGRQKLLLPYAGGTMIGHVVKQVRESGVGEIVVVVGRDGEKIREALAGEAVRFVVNDGADADMLSSVRAGLRVVGEEFKAVMIVLGDQPGVSGATMRKLVEQHQGGITAPVYGGRRGHPEIIATKYREEVLRHFDGEGLRALMATHAKDVREVAVKEGSVLDDIDTNDDYQRLIR